MSGLTIVGVLSDNNAYVTTAISVASLITENLLSHPFIVLRRQCQVCMKLPELINIFIINVVSQSLYVVYQL